VGDKTAIEWTDATWNPVTGCNKVSPGCAHCYASPLAKRLQAMGVKAYARGFDVTCHPDRLDWPLRWKKPRRTFVNSMSDLYHDRVPDAFIREVFTVMERADRHIFQVLTKRPERLIALAPSLPWPPNIWQGVSVESARYVSRIDLLRQVPAAIRFLSVEPLLGPIPHLPLDGIHWVIVGGESGPGYRPMDPTWACDIRDQCLAASVAFFFKQVGGPTPKAGGRLLDGLPWDEYPC